MMDLYVKNSATHTRIDVNVPVHLFSIDQLPYAGASGWIVTLHGSKIAEVLNQARVSNEYLLAFV